MTNVAYEEPVIKSLEGFNMFMGDIMPYLPWLLLIAFLVLGVIGFLKIMVPK